MPTQTLPPARELYPIDYWSDGFFAINNAGEITLRLDDTKPDIPLSTIIKTCQAAGLQLPLLLRFNAILHQRTQRLAAAFATAMQQHAYQQTFTPVYPIKVNQQYQVVREILQTPGVTVGLEAGSKPELLAILGLTEQPQLIICNGYKDQEYLHLALIAQQLGHRVYIIIEKLAELDLLLPLIQQSHMKPRLGIRVRLATLGAGNWQNTGGEKAKFGLTADQVLQAVEKLKRGNVLSQLELLHCHMGSQIANIHDIQSGMQELARYYVDLHRLGCPIKSVDVGGGLGVDYEGTRSRRFCSMNYSVQQYAHAIVRALDEACQTEHLPQPEIFTESGRAMTAHHAVLITNVVAHETADLAEAVLTIDETAPHVLQDLWQCYVNITTKPLLETYHDATHWLQEAYSCHRHGLLNLAQRAHAERIYLAICHALYPKLNRHDRAHRDVIDHLHEKLATKYFANFSLFQSLPDVWAIQQVFPVLPLTGLNQPATQRIKIQDITCDSDGQIHRYVDGDGLEATLPVPHMPPDQPILFGIFLVGAYQEILGDMHNLFGDTDSVHITLDGQGGFDLEHALKGDNISDVLRYVHFDVNTIMQSYRRQLNQAALTPKQRTQYLQYLQTSLTASTYLETTTCNVSSLPREKVS